MATLDIRKPPESTRITRIVFGDNNRDGLGKACYVDDGTSHQCNIVSRGCDSIHVKYNDIDYLIAALKKAKELWHKP